MRPRPARRPMSPLAALAWGSIVVALAALVSLALTDVVEIKRDVPLPPSLRALADRDEVAYPLHAILGTTASLVHGPPTVAALQWVKAASHAPSQADLRRAADGIAAARQRGGGPTEERLCAYARHGSPTVQTAIALGGARCAAGFFVRMHVPDGAPVDYGVRPPIGGPHYASPHPDYGVLTEPVPPGRWLHNLEHGAIVLLYNCPADCPGLVDELGAIYASLPAGRNARDGGPRMLLTRYHEMDRPIAVVGWGHLLELDQLEPDRVARFYAEHLDRGPECRDLVCPR
jgi:hypothetical protein